MADCGGSMCRAQHREGMARDAIRKGSVEKQLGFSAALASAELGVSRSVTEQGHSRPSSGLRCFGGFLGIREESLSGLLLDLPSSLNIHPREPKVTLSSSVLLSESPSQKPLAWCAS